MFRGSIPNSGKKFYHNVIPGSQVKTEPFYVAIITPVIYYCMGGLEIDTHSRVLNAKGEIPGLYAAGEVGHVSGKHAAKYILGNLSLIHI